MQILVLGWLYILLNSINYSYSSQQKLNWQFSVRESIV